ncbi:MAG: DUF177 domain-containing protein [Victivallales bacterium]|nr:DUF177 domain-containing protein [Victivallales bacterium]
MSVKEKNHNVLCVHVTDIPSEGVDLDGEVPFKNLDIEEDDVTRLPWPMNFHLHLTQLGGDLLVTGKISASVELMCDRCAEFSRHELSASDVCHRYENVAGEVVDLTDGLREDILITFPQTHLCSEDCKGVCPHCGKNLNEGPCDCVEEQEDDAEEDAGEDEESKTANPWAALDKLKF